MRVGQQALGHAHRQEWRAALFNKTADRCIGLRISRALAEDDERALGAFEYVECALDRLGRRNLRRRRIDDFDQGAFAGGRVHRLTEQFGRQVEIDTARPARNRRANRACEPNANVLCVQHTERRLA